MNYQRHLDYQLQTHFDNYKQAIVLLGARQVGKTTILKKIFPEANYLLVDNEYTREILNTYDIHSYRSIIGNLKTIIIDEIHLLDDPGRAIKILYDQIEDLRIIVTGSSALNVKNKSTESLAGRKIEYKLFPLTFSEKLVQLEIEEELNKNIFDNIVSGRSEDKPRLFNVQDLLFHTLLYGLYPEAISLSSPKLYLKELADSVVFKDIVELKLIEDKNKARSLLKLLAYQIGNIINYTEIAGKLKMSRKTVERYIDIFEESFILYRIYPYSSNKRDEIGKAPKIYFYDVGLRNAIVNNFDSINIRSDACALFENFIFSELKKIISYYRLDYDLNYWRLKSGSEVDVVISNTNRNELYGVEVKLNKGKISKAFNIRYPNAKTHLINSNNFY